LNIRQMERVSRPDDRINDQYSVAWGFSEVVDLTTEIHVPSKKAKRKAEAAAAVAAYVAASKNQGSFCKSRICFCHDLH
jgi:hypothetical protein